MHTNVDWADLRRRFAGGRGESQTALAASAGVSQQAVAWRVKHEDWYGDAGRTAPAPRRASKRRVHRDSGLRNTDAARAARAAEAAVAEGAVRRRCPNCIQLTSTDPCEHCQERIAA